MEYPEGKEIVLYGITGEEKFAPEIKVQYDSSSEIQNVTINDDVAASSFIRGLYEEESIEVQEYFFVLYLNRRNKIKGYYKHAIGGINSVTVDTRIILAVAMKSLSTSIIVAHNHPSGSILPSEEDIRLSKRLKEAAKLFDIKLLDSIILTKDGYYSMANHGSELGIITAEDTKKKIVHTPEKSKIKSEGERKMAKNVNSLTEEIKFIRRFVGLHNKVKSPNSILSFIRALQKSISQRLITKFSPYVKHISYIQDTLIEFYNKMKGDKKILIEESTLATLMAISGREKVYPSVAFIKAFIGMQGKEISEEKRQQFLKRLNNAANNKKIFPNDPFAEKLQKIYTYLKSRYRSGDRVAFARAELSGLSCICKNYDKSLGTIYTKKVKGRKTRICNSYRYSDAGRGACSYNGGLAGVPAGQSSPAIDPSRRSMNSMDFVKLKFQGIGFSGKWKNFIGDPTSGFTAMVFGMPKFGKSFLCLDFAGYLARNHGKVMYVAKEEDLDKTLQIKVVDKDVANPNLDLYNYIPEDLSNYKFVFFDSVTRLGLTPEDLARYEKTYPGISFIYVFQVRKDGVFRGRNDFQHDVDVVIEVPEKGKAIQSGRYNQGGEMDIFPTESSN